MSFENKESINIESKAKVDKEEIKKYNPLKVNHDIDEKSKQADKFLEDFQNKSEGKKANAIDNLSVSGDHFEWSGKDTIFFIDWEKIPVNKIFALWDDYKNYIEPSEYDKKWVSEYNIKPKNNVLIETVIDSMSQEEMKNNTNILKKILLLQEFSWGLVGVKNLVKHLWLIEFDEDGKINKSEFNMKYDDDRTPPRNLWSILLRAVVLSKDPKAKTYKWYNLVHIKFTSNGTVDWFWYPPISHWPVL